MSAFASRKWTRSRTETYGQDLGQTSWVSTEESNRIPELVKAATWE